VLNSPKCAFFTRLIREPRKLKTPWREGVEFELASDLVALFASDRAAFISGADYVLDGGTMPTV
jgi:hypothetical protein